MRYFLISLFIFLTLSACSGNGSSAFINQETECLPLHNPQSTHQPLDKNAKARKKQLETAEHWFYYLGFDPDKEVFQQIVVSTYDLVVLEPIITERENTDFPIRQRVKELHNAAIPKIVLAYIDIGEAEEWRTYWQPDWHIGHPEFIQGDDPDGWEGNYPVAYWQDEWKDIWLKKDGILDQLIAVGFDGVYLDWIEGYSDESVIAAAEKDGVDAEHEMIRWVQDIAAHCRLNKPVFLIIGQNAAELATHDNYFSTIDAISQEQVWFDGGADNQPPGDCPLPRSEAEVESAGYVSSLSPVCRHVYYQFPESTLHTSSEYYLTFLKSAQKNSKLIFTIDYALEPENIAWIYQTARTLGFVPFVTERNVNTYLSPYP